MKLMFELRHSNIVHRRPRTLQRSFWSNGFPFKITYHRQRTLSLGNYHLFSTSKNSEDKDNSCQSTFSPNGDSKYLRIDAPTMQNLEILSFCNDRLERGALLSFVYRARTPAGRRLLRKWIAEPLVSSTDINDRLDAIGDIHRFEDSSEGAVLMEVLKHLKTKKDLECALPKSHQQATVATAALPCLLILTNAA